MNIAICTTLWKRHDLEELTLRRLRKVADRTREGGVFWVECLAVGSEGVETETLANFCGWDYLEAPNAPLGRKHNLMIREAQRLFAVGELDAVFIMGSDDWCTDGAIKTLVEIARNEVARNNDDWNLVVGLTDCYFSSTLGWGTYHWPGYAASHARFGEPIGAGRLIFREALERCGWKLWDDYATHGLDAGATSRLRAVGARLVGYPQQSLQLRLVDFKSKTNLWSISAFRKPPSRRVLTADTLSVFPAEEVAELMNRFPLMLGGSRAKGS